MQSKFHFTPGEAFKGTPVEGAFKTLLDLGLRKDEFAIVGSSGLHFLSTTALSRGDSPLITRAPHDIDILVVDRAKQWATEHGFRIESNIGRGYLVKLDLQENKGDLLDVTTAWPVGPEVHNAKELRKITQEVNGIQVMEPSIILELKHSFNRVKDRPDIIAAEQGLAKNALRPLARISTKPRL